MQRSLDENGLRKHNMFAGMDHVGIAVRNLDAAIHVYRDMLGYNLEAVHELTERKTKVALMSGGGQAKVELLMPLDAESTIAKFLDTRGEGIHHFAMRVDNIEQMLEELKAKDVNLIDEKPKVGAGGAKIAFIHPKSTNGVLIELCERR
jgi:methylmalonyl-CoA/ethylmalonyl-CoA epimerase